MKLQRFIGKNTKVVMDEIRTTLGEEALIVSNTQVGSKTEIIAASDPKTKSAKTLEGKSTKNVSFDEAKVAADFQSNLEAESHKREIDPWTHIKNINEEIQAIKSSLRELPLVSAKAEPEIAANEQTKNNLEAEPKSLRELDDQISEGCHLIWGERKSGKTSVLERLLGLRKPSEEIISIIRLPHVNSNNDSHLADVAERNSANLFYINNIKSIESTIDMLGRESLIFVEADLSMLSQIATLEGGAWLQSCSSYIVNENNEQTKLIAQLFSELKANAPIALSTETAESIVYKREIISTLI